MMNPEDICDGALEAAVRKSPKSVCIPSSVPSGVEEFYQAIQIWADGLPEGTSYLTPLHEYVGNVVAWAQHSGD